MLFFGAETDHRKMTWVRWKKVMAHKQYGGLGVSSLFASNRALLFKWIWRFYSSHSGLWLYVIKAIYGPKGGLDQPFSVQSGSLVWTSIRKAISNLKSKGVDLMDFYKKVIGNASVALSPASDRFTWSLDGNGIFSVKSAREEIDKYFLINSSSSTRWSKLLPIKLNVFAWRMFLDKLPTRTNLSNRVMDIPCVLCLVCECEVESRNHLFFGCPLAIDLFSLMGRWWNIHIPSLQDPVTWEAWFNGLRLNSIQRSMLEASFFSLWWHI
ncbi:RNA-directed DNA polymerase, eukaryota, reverse transcriptase zinc-binding domain protein [Tanacetum coccineum]